MNLDEVSKTLVNRADKYQSKMLNQLADAISALQVRMVNALNSQSDWNYRDVNRLISILDASLQEVGMYDIAAEFREAAKKQFNDVSGIPQVSFTAAEATAFVASTNATLNGWEKTVSADLISWIQDRLSNQIINLVPADKLATELMSEFDVTEANASTYIRTALNGQIRDTFQLAGQAMDTSEWEYVGPNDDRTRDDCLQYLDQKYFNTDEMMQIEAEPRYNCRHFFRPVISTD